MKLQSDHSIMQIVIKFLLKHTWLNLLLIVLYCAFIIFMHDQLTLPNYNQWVKYIGIASALLILIYLSKAIFHNNAIRKLKIAVVLIIALLWAIHVSIMLEMNIEIIHGLMYSILAFLLFAYTGRFAATLIIALIFMLLDEYCQYIILYPGYVQYYELNDVILDILGCYITFSLLIVKDIQPHYNLIPLKKRYELYLFPFVLLLLLVGLFSCFFVVYPKDVCNNTLFVFNRLANPELFWQKHPFTQAVYHVVSLWEAVLIIAIFFIGFVALDCFYKNKTKHFA
jgi:hypothetical protein